ncbi:MAG: hypothetical protein HGB12_09955 [Bacteroidetes bacterium]|nr:hypothetical protein [Bacteroidota bacterium]
MGNDMEVKDERELKALISLVDEPDINIFREITEKIYSYGFSAIPLLEEKWENTLDEKIQQRILSIIHKIQFQNICIELDKWAKSDLKDLLTAFILISRSQYPDVKEEELKKKIENIRKDIWLEINSELTSLEKVKVLNHIFYDVYGFGGNIKNFHTPQNSYLNTLLETRKGNPLSIGMLYMIIAQQLNIPVFGVNMPEHFVLCYTNEHPEDSMKFIDINEVLFYINPFSKGAVFTRKEAEMFIAELKLEPLEIFFKPCSNLDIIRRLINNLLFSYKKIEEPEKIQELELLMNIINQSRSDKFHLEAQ